MSALPWFRFYTEAIDDEKLGLLAFEDRWHFVALLCLKGKGVLDGEPDLEMLQRKVAFKMGLTCSELEKVTGRLSKMGLIEFGTMQPRAWDERQMQGDSSKARVAAFRERQKQEKRYCNVTVTAQEEDIDKEEDKEEEKTAAPSAKLLPEKKPAPSAVVKPDGVTQSVWEDFIKVRAKLKAPITKTSIDGIAREAKKAGWSLEDALRECCERSWRGFKADWVSKALTSNMMAGVI